MEFDRKKKLRSIKFLALRELLLTLGMFLCYILFLTIFVEYTTTGLHYDWAWRIFFLICAVACLLSCTFEIRLLTAYSERFLGYKAYLLYISKWLYLGLSALTSYLTVTYVSTSYLWFVLINLLWVIAYYALLFVLTFRYRKYFARGYVLISYLQEVHEWWKEGKMPPPPPKPEQPEKEKPEKPKKPKKPKKEKPEKINKKRKKADAEIEKQSEEQAQTEQPQALPEQVEGVAEQQTEPAQAQPAEAESQSQQPAEAENKPEEQTANQPEIGQEQPAAEQPLPEQPQNQAEEQPKEQATENPAPEQSKT